MAITKATASSVAPAAKGDLVVGSGTNDAAVLAVASTAGYLLSVDSAEATGLKWAAPSSPTWTTYSPTVAGVTVGNGTSTWRYATSGKITFIYGSVKFGSTSSMTGPVTFTLPNTISQSNSQWHQIGYVDVEDAGTTGYSGTAIYYSIGNVVYVRLYQVNSTYASAADLSSTIPMTWTTNDSFDVMCWYQEA